MHILLLFWRRWLFFIFLGRGGGMADTFNTPTPGYSFQYFHWGLGAIAFIAHVIDTSVWLDSSGVIREIVNGIIVDHTLSVQHYCETLWWKFLCRCVAISTTWYQQADIRSMAAWVPICLRLGHSMSVSMVYLMNRRDSHRLELSFSFTFNRFNSIVY